MLGYVFFLDLILFVCVYYKYKVKKLNGKRVVKKSRLKIAFIAIFNLTISYEYAEWSLNSNDFEFVLEYTLLN